MFKLVTTIFLVIIAIISVNCASVPKLRQMNVLDDSKFPKGSKIGFSCRKIQAPMMRAMKRIITMTSVTIMKSTSISINGQMVFHLRCTRDIAVDRGDIVPPNLVEKEVKAEGITETTEMATEGEDPLAPKQTSEQTSEETSMQTSEQTTDQTSEQISEQTSEETVATGGGVPEEGITDTTTETGGDASTAGAETTTEDNGKPDNGKNCKPGSEGCDTPDIKSEPGVGRRSLTPIGKAKSRSMTAKKKQ